MAQKEIPDFNKPIADLTPETTERLKALEISPVLPKQAFDQLAKAATPETTHEVLLALELGRGSLRGLPFTGHAETARDERDDDNPVDYQDSPWSLHGNHSD